MKYLMMVTLQNHMLNHSKGHVQLTFEVGACFVRSFSVPAAVVTVSNAWERDLQHNSHTVAEAGLSSVQYSQDHSSNVLSLLVLLNRAPEMSFEFDILCENDSVLLEFENMPEQ